MSYSQWLNNPQKTGINPNGIVQAEGPGYADYLNNNGTSPLLISEGFNQYNKPTLSQPGYEAYLIRGSSGNSLIPSTPYQMYVNSITEQYQTGKINAETAKNLLLDAAEENRQTAYAAADRQLEESNAIADQTRERAIVDANSSYQQNLAGYGANAEAMANMGLTGSGYSDWLNAAAYAQNRGDVQAANAQSETAKRDAKYIADQTKNQADTTYNDAVFKAEADYLDTVNNLDTTYKTNLAEAELKNKENQLENKLNYKATMTAYTTDAEIDQMVKDGLISKRDATELKAYRGTLGSEEINSYISSGDYASATSTADKLYASKIIDQDTYQNAYFEAEKSNINQDMSPDDIRSMEAEIDNAVKAGKLSSTDAASLKNYMYQTACKTITKEVYTLSQDTISGTMINLGSSGSYKLKTEKVDVDKDTTYVLNQILSSNNNKGQFVMYKGTLYLKPTNGNWKVLKNTKNSDGKMLYDAFNKEYSYQPAATAPKHSK